MNFSMNRLTGACVLVAAVGAGLSACVPLAIVGGAAGAGTLVLATERRSNETQTADTTIEQDARQNVINALAGRGHVTVTSYYRKVLLTGEVPTEQDRKMVESIVARTPSVTGVVNDLAVMPNSGPGQRSNDTYVTGKVKARFLDANGVPASAIRVVTERGTTYLMGRLTAHETEVATQVARQTAGVQRVVRVIDQIVESAGTGAAPVMAPASAPAGAVPLTTDAAAAGVVTQPVRQTTVQEARPPMEVKTLPPAK